MTEWLGSAVEWLVDYNLLPLSSVLIEPAKVLFLNNAINHGVLTPLGIQQAAEQGYSILFLLEANPGPGWRPAAGLLLLRSRASRRPRRRARSSSSSSAASTRSTSRTCWPSRDLILATILGGMTGIAVNMLFDTGLRAPAAPGSFLAVCGTDAQGHVLRRLLVGPRSRHGLVPRGRVPAQARPVRRRARPRVRHRGHGGDEGQEVRGVLGARRRWRGRPPAPVPSTRSCSPATPAWVRRPWAPRCCVARCRRRARRRHGGQPAIPNLTDEWDLVVTHQDLTERARQRTPSAVHVSVDNFMGSPRYDEIVELLHEQPRVRRAPTPRRPRRPLGGDVLAEGSIVLAGSAASRDDAISEAGQLLVAGRRGGPVVRRRDARAGALGVDAHGQPARHPARHQRGQGRHPADRDLVRALPGRDRLERQADRVRDRHRRCGRRPPAHPAEDRRRVRRTPPRWSGSARRRRRPT